MDGGHRLSHRLAFVHQLSTQVRELVAPRLVLRHHIPADIESQPHEVGLIGILQHLLVYAPAYQAVEEEQCQQQQHADNRGIEDIRRDAVLLALGRVPLAVKLVDDAALFQTGKLAVDGVE